MIITYGTFDLFHYGHLRILQRAKALGDKLIVAVSSEKFNAIKGKKCVYPYRQRARIVAAIKFVDKVIPEHTWEQKSRDIKKHKVDILVMGNDWRGKFDHFNHLCKIVYLPRTANISSTGIKINVKKHH